MRGKVSLEWQLPRETKSLGYTYAFPINLTVWLSCQRILLIGLFHCWLLFPLWTREVGISEGPSGIQKSKSVPESNCDLWIEIPYALLKIPAGNISQLIFKPAIPRPLNETINSIMSVTCFWHVKSATLYILLISVPAVKWIYRHDTRCFIDVTCHDPLMPHWSTKLRFWPRSWIRNQSDTDFFVKEMKKEKKKKYLSYLLCGVNSYSCLLISLHVFWLHGCCCYSSNYTFTIITFILIIEVSEVLGYLCKFN